EGREGAPGQGDAQARSRLGCRAGAAALKASPRQTRSTLIAGCAPNRVEKAVFVERLLEIRPARVPHRFKKLPLVMGGNKHHRRPMALSPELFLQFEAADAWQVDIEDGAIGLTATRQVSFRRLEDMDRMAKGTEQSPDG